MALLFEYGNWESVINKDALKQMLKDIWKQRIFVGSETELSETDNGNHLQPFLNFDNCQVRANNYVGFIQNDNDVIEIYPKVFRNSENARAQARAASLSRRLAGKHVPLCQFPWLHPFPGAGS